MPKRLQSKVILLAGETYPPDVNGAGIFTRRLAEGLANKGHRVHVVVPSPHGYSYEADHSGVRVLFLASTRYPWHPTFHIASLIRVRGAVNDAFNDIRPDIVHVQAHFVVGRAAAREAKHRGVPLIATNHFMPENLKYQLPFSLPKPVYSGLAKFAWHDLAVVYRDADAITAPTRYAAELLKSKANLIGVIPISCGVDVERYTTTHVRRSGQGGIVLFVGRLDPEKHVHEIIDALAYMHQAVRLRIVGEGRSMNVLQRRACLRGVSDRVEFAGFLSDEEVLAEFRRADVFCMPGTAELQSIATLEAMASGLPVVAAAANALPELVRPGVNGDLYPSGDVVRLANALQNILDDPRRRMMLSTGSRATATSHDLPLTVEEFEDLYLKASR